MIPEIIAAVLLLGWLGFSVWSWFQPTPKLSESQEHDRQIGYVVGLLGGSIEDAVTARYAIQRLEEDLGRRATMQEMGVAIGVSISLD
jgi:hypothetical protein